MSKVRALPLVFAAGLAGCFSGQPPVHWNAGGAPLDVPRARWTFGESVVVIEGDGRVRINGDPEFTVDPAGRVFDGEATPLALLEPDGRVVGPDDRNLGFVGSTSASLPGERNAWLELTPTGEVIRFDDEGERHPFGVWVGECNQTPRAAQLCTLVTHLLGMRLRSRGFGTRGLSIGFGIGVH